MDTTILDEKTTEQNNLGLDPATVTILNQGRKWAMFIAILGFIGVGLMVIFSLIALLTGSFLGNQMAGAPVALIGGVYLVMAVLMFFPTFYLAKFAQKAGIACSQNDYIALQDAIINLYKNLKIRGIYYIVMIAIYVIAIFVAIAVGVTSIL